MTPNEIDALVEEILTRMRDSVREPKNLDETEIENTIRNALWCAGEPEGREDG